MKTKLTIQDISKQEIQLPIVVQLYGNDFYMVGKSSNSDNVNLINLATGVSHWDTYTSVQDILKSHKGSRIVNSEIIINS